MSRPPVEGSERPKDASRRRSTLSLLIVILIVLAVTIGAVSYFHTRSDGTYHDSYRVRVEATNTEEYIIRLPVPNDESHQMPPYFMEELEVVTGQPVFALAEYDYGTGLEIRAKGYLEIRWTKVWPESWNVRYGNLTMTSGAEGWSHSGPARSWIFSDRSDIKILLQYSSIHHYMATPTFASGGGPNFYFYEYLNGTGWQNVPIDYGWLLIN